jgi:hypothetical protein
MAVACACAGRCTWQVSRFRPDLLCDFLQVKQSATTAGARHKLGLGVAHAGALRVGTAQHSMMAKH